MDDLEQALNKLSLASSQSPDETVRAAQHLAEASKSNLQVRAELGKPLTLQHLVALVDCSLNDSIETTEVALRCIGNACIDNDAARQNVADIGFSWAKRCLISGQDKDLNTALLTAKVLYNICLDFEPAQQQCYREHVHHELIQLLAAYSPLPSGQEQDAPLVIELLYLIASQRTTDSENIGSPMKRETLVQLLVLPTRYIEFLSTEDYTMLIGVCTTLMRAGEVSEELSHCADEIWNLLRLNELYIRNLQQGPDFDVDEEKLLVGLSTDMIWSLSDLTASPFFHRNNDTGTSWVESVALTAISYGNGRFPNRMSVAACQVLGNTLWSTKDGSRFAWLVEGRAIHKPLLQSMCSSEDAEVLHSAAGVAIQLCRPSAEIRGLIAGDDSVASALQRLCRHENPMIKQDGIKFLRALGQERPDVQQRFAQLAEEVMKAASTTNADASGDTMMLNDTG